MSDEREVLVKRAYEAAREELSEYHQQDDYLLAHGASLLSEESHEIFHVDALLRVVEAAVSAALTAHGSAGEPVAEVCSVVAAGDKGVRIRWKGGHPKIGTKLYASPFPSPEGVVVPREPTKDMLEEGFDAMNKQYARDPLDDTLERTHAVYRAMLAASPAAPMTAAIAAAMKSDKREG